MKKHKYKKQIALGRDADGKLVRKWIYADSMDQLLLQKGQLKDEFKNGGISSDPYWYDYAMKWMETYKANASDATRAWTERCINQCELIHYKRMSEITHMDCQQIINSFADRPDAAKKVALVLKQIFAHWSDERGVKSILTRPLQLPRKVKKQQRTLSKDEVAQIRELLNDDRLEDQDRMFLACLYYMGLRPEEARALMADDFDWDAETVTISKALAFPDGNQGVLKPTKTYNVRTLPVPTAVVNQLKAYCSDRTGYLFTKEDGEPLSMTSYRHMWNHIRKYIPGVTPYSLRRNYASHLFYSDISLKKAAYFMGHSDTRMITEVYAQIDDERENIDALKKMT